MRPLAGDGAIDEERRNDQQESDGDLADLVLLDANDVDTRQFEHVDSPDRCGHQHDEGQGESDGLLGNRRNRCLFMSAVTLSGQTSRVKVTSGDAVATWRAARVAAAIVIETMR